MKPKNLSMLSVVFTGALVLLTFQNCSKVAVSDNPGSSETVALATDNQGNMLPVDVGNSDQVVPPSTPVSSQPTANTTTTTIVMTPTPTTMPATPTNPVPSPTPIPGTTTDKSPTSSGQTCNHDDEGDDQDRSNHVAVEEDSDDPISACGLNPKTIHKVIDLAQFKGQDVNLSVLQGKTLVYSSDPSVSLKSLSIDSAVGRTILCGCKVDRLNLKKGRLEVYRSEIKEIGERHGTLIKDDKSILPSGN